MTKLPDIVMPSCEKKPCTCGNPYCGYSFGRPAKYAQPEQAEPVKRSVTKCSCGNTDDPQCLTDAHADYCKQDRR